jgi:hypothetical protein
MDFAVGDRVITPFGGIGTIIADPEPIEYHTLVRLDDPDGVERVNPRHFLAGSLEPVADTVGAQLSLLG